MYIYKKREIWTFKTLLGPDAFRSVPFALLYNQDFERLLCGICVKELGTSKTVVIVRFFCLIFFYPLFDLISGKLREQ